MTRANENLWISGLILVYLSITLATINLGYIDFGDGNYLYISGRMADGVRLYEEITAPQPPVHLLIGTCLVSCGRWIAGFLPEGLRATFPIYFVRIYLAFLHAAVIFVLWLVAKKIFDEPAIRIGAVILYILLPNTYLWSRGYQSECIEVLFLYVAFLSLLKGGRLGMLVASSVSVLGIFTNMTFAPYLLLFILYCLLVRPHHWILYVFPTLGMIFVGIVFFQKLFHGAYIQNVFFNQMGTYPPVWPTELDKALGVPSLLSYSWKKLVSEGGGLMAVEGGTIVVGFLGMFLMAGTANRLPNRGLILWFCLFTFGSIIFVTKGGTMEYIFTIGEPMVALAASYFLYTVVVGIGLDLRPGRWRIERGIYVGRLIAVLFGAIVCFYQPCTHLARSLFTQTTYEAPEYRALKIGDLILQYAKDKDDEILAAPYYAFLTGRSITSECSETLIWHMRYQNAWRAEASKLVCSNPVGFANLLEKDRDPLAVYLRNRISQKDIERLLEGLPDQTIPSLVISDGARADMGVDAFYDEQRFLSVDLSSGTRQWAEDRPVGLDLIRLNRILLAEAYPEFFKNKDTSPVDPGLEDYLGRITDDLKTPGKTAIVFLRTEQLGKIPEIRETVESEFERLTVGDDVLSKGRPMEIRTSNETMEVYVPKRRSR